MGIIKALSLYFLIISNCYASEVYDQIVKNNPNINTTYAKRVAKHIKILSKKYRVNPNIYTAILAQESMYKLDAKNCTEGYNNTLKETRVCQDFGISQINYKTIQAYQFNTQRLLNDLEYSIEAGLIVLSDIKRYFKGDKYYWVRYNVGTAKEAINTLNAQEYKRKVKRYMHRGFDYERL